ncbi:MAG: cation:proton antiporter [Janthinobacterium lividum]
MPAAFTFLPQWPWQPDLVLWAGLVLTAAGLCGEFGWRVWRVPRVTGFTVIGLIAGQAGFHLISAELASQARLLMDMALGLLLFELGSRLSLRWIRTNPWIIATSLAESLLTFVAVLIVLRLLGVATMTSVVIAGIVMSTSPAMVIQLKTDLKSEGQVTERLVALSVMNSMLAVVIVKLAGAWAHQEFYGNLLATVIEPIYLIVGSLVLAFLLARACSWLYRAIPFQDEHSFVALLGIVLLAIAVAHLLKLSTILALLAAGILFKNLNARPQVWPPHFGSAGWVLTVTLFVLTMISFDWHYIGIGAVAALALLVVRLLTKLAGVLVFAKPSGINFKQGVALGLSLSPISALAYVLVDDVYALYPGFDPALRAIMMCAIVVMQLLAPLLVYRALSAVSERS